MVCFRILSTALFAAGVLISASAPSATAANRIAESAVAPSRVLPFTAHPQTVLHVFTGADGALPFSNVVADASGALYGTTSAGGGGTCVPNGCGTVFKLSPPASGATSWTLRVLHAFPGTGTDGVGPVGGLIVDSRGALYGVTSSGGGSKNPSCSGGCGTVFKLTPPLPGKAAWTESVLHAFTGPGADGNSPNGGLIADGSGAIYGTTVLGGGCGYGGCGTVFKLTPPTPGMTAWSESILYSFSGPDGESPYGGVIADAHGVLYGTTYAGGAGLTVCPSGNGYGGCGTVFKLAPPALGHAAWTESVLYSFSGGADGKWPLAGLIEDAHGALYGTTGSGGGGVPRCNDGCGTVFKVTPPVAGKSVWTKNLLHSFTGADGAFPEADLTTDARGALYGTTRTGGVGSTACLGGQGCGTVFKLTPPISATTAWTESVLHFFTGTAADGDGPIAGLLDVGGYLYGTTYGASENCNFNAGGCGTVFKIRL